MPGRPGLLVLMGSGETSPTMVETHRRVVRALGAAPLAVLLDTPYAFQENAADISARARAYFSRSVGLRVEAGAAVAGADWVFSGPGSPTYALERWARTSVAGDLRARVRSREGATVLASAAACTAGVATVPVYEIYKVGAEPYWGEGLDLLAPLGLRVVVIPHFDNAEGGTHDTRFCYLGERRLALMEPMLPEGTAVLGIDEHTALVVDLRGERVRVEGRGAVTVRLPGSRAVLPAGTRTDLDELRRLARGAGGRPVPVAGRAAEPPEVTLAEVARECAGRFERALAVRDSAGATRAVLDLEAAVALWAADTEEDEGGVERARETLRGLVAELGEAAGAWWAGDLVDGLLTLRTRLRQHGDYRVADGLREALRSAGVLVEDTPDGPRWTRSG